MATILILQIQLKVENEQDFRNNIVFEKTRFFLKPETTLHY
jgi:hypothetical protein